MFASKAKHEKNSENVSNLFENLQKGDQDLWRTYIPDFIFAVLLGSILFCRFIVLAQTSVLIFALSK